MSKSYGNTIGLTEEPASITRKIKGMTTDPARARRTDPGTPEKCPVWDLHKLYSSDETRVWVREGCTEQAAELARGLLTAADAFDGRLPELFGNIERVLSADTGRKFVYAYFSELDALAHVFGIASPQVGAGFARLDAACRDFLSQLPKLAP